MNVATKKSTAKAVGRKRVVMAPARATRPATKAATTRTTSSAKRAVPASAKPAAKRESKTAFGADNTLVVAPDVTERAVIDDLSTRLLAFAIRRARLLSWWLGDAGALAKGNTVADVVLDAISRLYGGEHRWEPSKYPDPFTYLVLVVKTKLWNLAVSSENKLSERGVDEAALVEITTPETLLLEIEATRERQARASRAASALAAEFDDDDELASLHDLMSVQGVLKPAELSQRLGKPVPYINNLRKRLARAWKRVAIRLGTEVANG